VNRCRVCNREALPTQALFEPDLLLCRDHDVLVRGEYEASLRRPIAETLFGHGVPYDADDSSGVAPLRCDRCSATWSGRSGDRCYWCLSSYTTLLHYQRDLALQRSDIDPKARFEDYKKDVEVRYFRLLKGVEIGLVTPDESERVLNRLLRPLEVAS
jgi:hypothetical protein